MRTKVKVTREVNINDNINEFLHNLYSPIRFKKTNA